MRFDTPIYFQHVTEGPYDPATGDYRPDAVVEVQMFASVTDTGADTLNLVYGELKQGSLTVRLQMRYPEPFSRIRIGSKVYRVDMERRLRTKHVFVVSEVL
jgi:hypothetical protein